MREASIVVLSRFPEIFNGFKDSVDSDWPRSDKIVIWDRATKNEPKVDSPWYVGRSVLPFQMARSANFGWMGASRTEDILYAGDDTRIIEPDTIKRLQEFAYSDPAIGILSPSIKGVCTMNPIPTKENAISFVQYVGFVFVFIKREVIERVGYLDERYEGYSFDDIDYAVRVRQAGFKIGVARDITVQHGVNGHTYGSTFIKVRGEEQMGIDTKANLTRFAQKFGIENDPKRIFEFIEKLC